MELVRD